MTRLWASVLLAACGRLGFEPAARDGVMDDGVGEDTAVDSATPDGPPATGPFGTPTPIGELDSGAGEDDPTLSGDLLVVVFDSKRTGGNGAGDLWESQRDAIAAPWSTPRNLEELNTNTDDTTPDLARDGLTMYFATTRPDSLGVKDIYVTTRSSRDATWGLPIHLPELGSSADEAGPSITPDGLAIYFTSARTGNDDLWYATRDARTDPWSAPRRIDELATPAVEGEPWISPDQLQIVYSSTRPGSQASDLWIADRSSRAMPFGAPQRIVELATSMNETDPWLSPDRSMIIFARDNVLYVATR